MTFRASYDIIHNVKREAVSNQRNGKLMAPWVTVWKLLTFSTNSGGVIAQRNKKKLKKPLDKLKNLWYNKGVIKRGNLLNIKNRVATVAKMKGVYYDYS